MYAVYILPVIYICVVVEDWGFKVEALLLVAKSTFSHDADFVCR